MGMQQGWDNERRGKMWMKKKILAVIMTMGLAIPAGATCCNPSQQSCMVSRDDNDLQVLAGVVIVYLAALFAGMLEF